MELKKHIYKALKDYEEEDFDSSLMNACFAIDATAKNVYGIGGAKNYKNCIEKYVWIIEAIVGYGIDLEKTTWGNIEVDNGFGNIVNNPKLADIIYHIFRCSNAHGESISKNYEFLLTKNNEIQWQVGGGIIKMPQLVIQGLTAIAVLSKLNKIEGEGSKNYYLSMGNEKFFIKDWLGKEDDFKLLLSKNIPNPTKVVINGLDNFNPKSESEGFTVQIKPFWL